MHGRIEKIIFVDTTITDTTTLSQAAAVSAEAHSGQQAELAGVAERLAQEARTLVDPRNPGGVKLTSGEGGQGAEIGPEPGANKDRGAKDKDEKKHD